jgi:hypothetical protein
MTWLTLRQFRASAIAAAIGLGLAALVLALTPQGTELTRCVGQVRCPVTSDKFLGLAHGHLLKYLSTGLVALPGLLGAFWGAPLLARELESGTYRLAWTQSVTRTRWLAVKLGVVGVAAVLAAGLVSLMVTWWAHPIDHVTANRYSAEIFSTRGLVPIGYAVFAFALGATLGLLIRRTLPAMAATLAGYVGVHLAVIAWVRPHLAKANHLSLPLRAANGFGFTRASGDGGVHFFASGATIPNSLVVSNHLVDKAGQVPSTQALDQFLHTTCPAIVSPTPGGDPTGELFNDCLTKLAANYHLVAAVIPASRYWDLQLAETGLYLVFAAVLTAACFWWIRHRLR